MSCQVFHVLHFKIAEVREVSGSSSGLLVKHRALKDYFDDTKPDIGVGTSSVQDHLFLSFATFRAFLESRKIPLLGLRFVTDRLSQGLGPFSKVERFRYWLRIPQLGQLFFLKLSKSHGEGLS
ncbi:hypothetical protein CR513_35206, partial [Mucuna pruriens]